MKTAFESYYKKLDELYNNEYGTHPTVSYEENILAAMLISDINEDEEVEWGLYPVEDFNLEKASAEIGIVLSVELRGFYSTYYYAQLSGKIENTQFYFTSNCTWGNKVSDFMKQQYNDARYYFNDGNYFLLGIANVSGADDNLIFYDNDTMQVFLYDNDTGNRIIRAESLCEIINNMDACE